MDQGFLFSGSNAYGEPMANPIVHSDDPKSSREAAEKHTKSGKRKKNADLVLMLVKVYPRKTANELWELAGDLDKFQLVDYYEIRRRLTDLEHAGLVRVFEQRECSVKKSLMQTFEFCEKST